MKTIFEYYSTLTIHQRINLKSHWKLIWWGALEDIKHRADDLGDRNMLLIKQWSERLIK